MMRIMYCNDDVRHLFFPEWAYALLAGGRIDRVCWLPVSGMFQ